MPKETRRAKEASFEHHNCGGEKRLLHLVGKILILKVFGEFVLNLAALQKRVNPRQCRQRRY